MEVEENRFSRMGLGLGNKSYIQGNRLKIVVHVQQAN